MSISVSSHDYSKDAFNLITMCLLYISVAFKNHVALLN